MSVQTTISRADYTGNGTTTTFTVPFYFLVETDLAVNLQDNGVDPPTLQTLIYPTDYAVSGAGDEAGGSITLSVAPTSSQQITILRNMTPVQLTSYVPNDPFPAKSHETALDRLTMLIQQLMSSFRPQVCVATIPGSTYTAPGIVAAVFVNGLIQPATSYTTTGKVVVFNYSLDPGDSVYAFCTSY